MSTEKAMGSHDIDGSGWMIGESASWGFIARGRFSARWMLYGLFSDIF